MAEMLAKFPGSYDFQDFQGGQAEQAGKGGRVQRRCLYFEGIYLIFAIWRY